MKKILLISLLVATQIVACSKDPAKPVETEAQSQQTSSVDNQAQQPQQAENQPATQTETNVTSYQEVFAKTAPILNTDASKTQAHHIMWGVNQGTENWKEIQITGTKIENPAVSSDKLANMEKSVAKELVSLGWKQDNNLSSDGNEGSSIGFIKDGHVCTIETSFNEQATGVTLDELLEEKGDELRDDQVIYAIKVACGKIPETLQ